MISSVRMMLKFYKANRLLPEMEGRAGKYLVRGQGAWATFTELDLVRSCENRAQPVFSSQLHVNPNLTLNTPVRIMFFYRIA